MLTVNATVAGSISTRRDVLLLFLRTRETRQSASLSSATVPCRENGAQSEGPIFF